MSAFDYPNGPLERKHGPRGYANYMSYREWLRDEFAFRCVYCLIREQWGRVTGEFQIDHFLAQAINPGLASDYDNLVYACTRCNVIKSAELVPDPSAVLTASDLRIQPDGTIESTSHDGEAIIWKLDLNAPEMVSWRLVWIRIVELAREHDVDLFCRLMGFPRELPDLGRLRPPGGNARPQGIAQSYFALSTRGELPPTY